MAKSKLNTWDLGRTYNDGIRDEIMPPLAKKLGLDELPMHHEDYNFFGAAISFFLKNSNLQEANLFDAASDVISAIISPTPTGKPAPVEDYVRRYQQQKDAGGPIQPFDRFFSMSVSQYPRGKGWAVLKKIGYEREKYKAVPIEQGGGGEDLITEETLPESHERSPYESLVLEEETPKREKALAAVPDYLKDQRAGAAAEQMWVMLQENERTGQVLKLKEMANILNSMGIPGPTKYGDWDESATFKLQRKVRKMVFDFMEREGVDMGSITLASRSRKGFRFCLRERF
jgi:hypothetical protein